MHALEASEQSPQSRIAAKFSRSASGLLLPVDHHGRLPPPTPTTTPPPLPVDHRGRRSTATTTTTTPPPLPVDHRGRLPLLTPTTPHLLTHLDHLGQPPPLTAAHLGHHGQPRSTTTVDHRRATGIKPKPHQRPTKLPKSLIGLPCCWTLIYKQAGYTAFGQFGTAVVWVDQSRLCIHSLTLANHHLSPRLPNQSLTLLQLPLYIVSQPTHYMFISSVNHPTELPIAPIAVVFV